MALDLWVLSDGRAGHDAQSLGLAEAIARRRAAEIRTFEIALPVWLRAFPPALAHHLGAVDPQWSIRAIGQSENPAPGKPDLILSTGRRAGLIAAGLVRATDAKAIQILDPKIGAKTFELMVLPGHDDNRADNVLRTLGALNRLTPDRVKDAAAAWAERMPSPCSSRLAVLIGGPSKSAVFGNDDREALIRALGRLAEDHTLIVTTSRRTPGDLVTKLKSRLPETASVWPHDGDNPFPAMLGHADAVLVTEDSVNMASEAATVGLPVHVFPVTSVSPKHAAFHRQLEAHGASRRFTGEIETWKYTALAETSRIAAEIVNRLGL